MSLGDRDLEDLQEALDSGLFPDQCQAVDVMANALAKLAVHAVVRDRHEALAWGELRDDMADPLSRASYDDNRIQYEIAALALGVL